MKGILGYKVERLWKGVARIEYFLDPPNRWQHCLLSAQAPLFPCSQMPVLWFKFIEATWPIEDTSSV